MARRIQQFYIADNKPASNSARDLFEYCVEKAMEKDLFSEAYMHNQWANLLFGYDVNERYVRKISGQFGLDFGKTYRVGIIAVDRQYGINLEQDEHIYEYYADCLNKEVIKMKGRPMFMKFLNKFVLLFEAKENMHFSPKCDLGLYGD